MAPIKSTIGRSVGKLLNSFRDRDLSLDSSVKTNRIPIPFSATGGTNTPAGITPGNGYRYHIFVSPGNFVVSGDIPKNIEIFAVGAGGNGGKTTVATQVGYTAGGGAGGIFYATSYSISAGTHPVTVGQSNDGSPDTEMRSPGADTIFVNINGPTTLTAKGGGFGNYYNYTGIPGLLPESPQGGPGGSSGGSAYGDRPPNIQPASQPTQNPGIANLTNYGNPGGDRASQVGNRFSGGGGGGAGGAGSNGSTSAGNGGPGQPFPAFAAPLISPEIPSPVRTPWTSAVGPTGLYGGGGGGAGSTHGSYPQSPAGTGGPGGGGSGVDGSTTVGSPSTKNAIEYTGGGGGGGGNSGGQAPAGGLGGSGIVVIRYLV